MEKRSGQWMVVLVFLAAGIPSWFYVEKRVADIYKKATDFKSETAPTPETAPVPTPAISKRSHLLKPANLSVPPPLPPPEHPSEHLPNTPAPPTDPVVLAELLRTGISADVQKCMGLWKQADPAFSGKVTLSFAFVPTTGLQSVDVLERETVPSEANNCLAKTIWSASWPAFRAPLTVTYPFELEIREEAGDER